MFWYLCISLFLTLWIRKVGLLAASRYRVSVSRSRLEASHFVHDVRRIVRSSLLCSFGVESEWVHSLDLLVASQEFPIMICWRVACAARECMTSLKSCLRRTTYVLLTRGMRGARMHGFVAMREPIWGMPTKTTIMDRSASGSVSFFLCIWRITTNLISRFKHIFVAQKRSLVTLLLCDI